MSDTWIWILELLWKTPTCVDMTIIFICSSVHNNAEQVWKDKHRGYFHNWKGHTHVVWHYCKIRQNFHSFMCHPHIFSGCLKMSDRIIFLPTQKCHSSTLWTKERELDILFSKDGRGGGQCTNLDQTPNSEFWDSYPKIPSCLGMNPQFSNGAAITYTRLSEDGNENLKHGWSFCTGVKDII